MGWGKKVVMAQGFGGIGGKSMGKANKRRACPEAGREISSAECGESRQSGYACPPECVHNPFGAVNYTRLLEIEDELERKPVLRLRDDTPDAGPIDRNLHRRDGGGAQRNAGGLDSAALPVSAVRKRCAGARKRRSQPAGSGLMGTRMTLSTRWPSRSMISTLKPWWRKVEPSAGVAPRCLTMNPANVA